MEEFFKVFALAILQGITEFLPVSSSGHLVLAEKLLGITAPGVRVEIMLHFGTLVAVLVYYRKFLCEIVIGMATFKRNSWCEALLIVLGCVPAMLAYFIVGDWLEARYDGNTDFIALMLIVTGCVLISLRFLRDGRDMPISWWRAVLIGVAQAVAMLPGISRSGSTIACARYLGVSSKKAADYSFLMSIPLLFGATALHILDEFTGAGDAVMSANQVGWGILIPAMAISAAVGYVSIKFLIKSLVGSGFWLFGVYCALAGALVLVF